MPEKKTPFMKCPVVRILVVWAFQTTFVLHPVELKAPDGELIGAASVHELGKGWLEQLQGEPAGESEMAKGSELQSVRSGCLGDYAM